MESKMIFLVVCNLYTHADQDLDFYQSQEPRFRFSEAAPIYG